uniref:AAA family ATPase n=1 Tax=Candidatus Scatousia sp. TaxID=3085663 RepID=UPI0040252E83
MKCPICKKTIPDNTLKCPYCKTRTGLICKNCHAVNSIYDIVCRKCGEEILRLCPECNSVNQLNAKKCRKCGYPFVEQVKVKDVIPEDISGFGYPAKFMTQESAKNTLVKGILNHSKKIFSLSGDRGIGKSVVLSHVINALKDKHFVWFYGKCTPITQLTPGGLIQDMMLNLFNLPNFCLNSLKFKKDATKFFQNEFPYLNHAEVNDFLNFLYPSQMGTFEEMQNNKVKTFDLLNKVFDKIISYSKFVIVVDNFENIDGFSYEFLSEFIKKENIQNELNLVLLYNEPKPSKGYFNLNLKNSDDIYLDISISSLTPAQMIELVRDKEENIQGFPYMNDSEKRDIFVASHGNPAFLEQVLSLRFDCQISDFNFKLPETYLDLVNERLRVLKEANKTAYVFLIASAILGDKINLNLLKQIFGFNDTRFSDIIAYLEQSNFIAPLSDIFYQFKDLLLWETIIKTTKNDAEFIDLNTKVCNALGNFTLNSNAIFGIIAQNLKHPKLALDIWTRNTRLASYIGDTNLYAISQKQCLALINELDESATLKTRYNISERLGKLLADFNPKEAMDYLPDAISNAQAIGDTPREIELLGYMAHCCERVGNYFGNVECVDAALSKINKEMDLEIALMKCAKLNSLLYIGNCGQIINMIDNEIMPVFDIYLGKTYTKQNIPFDFLYESWLKTYLILANALILQGNDRAFEILTILFDIIERNNISDKLFICKCKLGLAFANTMKGDFTSSEKMLEEILKIYRENSMDDEAILRWNLINITNNFLRKRYSGLQEDLFQVVTFANNAGDNFTKNMLKSLLGKIFKDNNQTKHAIEIYNDQIAYFSKEKMALGALLTWYLIAEAVLVTEGPYAAQEIASQALEVAQNPKIDNYFFTILLKIIIIKAAMTSSDYETAKMHLDSAIMLARQFNLNDMLSRLFLLYGKYFQEIGLISSPQQQEYLNGSAKMYFKASEYVRGTRNNYVHIEIEKAKNVLKSFCQLNSIKLG